MWLRLLLPLIAVAAIIVGGFLLVLMWTTFPEVYRIFVIVFALALVLMISNRRSRRRK